MSTTVINDPINEYLIDILKNYSLNKYEFNLFKIRLIESVISSLSKKSYFRGPVHTSIGQETAAVSVCCNLNHTDLITSNHRGHGHFLAKGGNATKLLLELIGSINGCCNGLGGSMHVADFKIGMYGANGIVGGGVAIAAGLAYALKLKNSKDIAVSFFGDGAINQGVVLESLNIAAILNLPLLLICENNKYALSSASTNMTKTPLSERARGFGITSYLIDGMNFDSSIIDLNNIISEVRIYQKPIFVEFDTYRFERHFTNEFVRIDDYLDINLHNEMIAKDPFIKISKEKNYPENKFIYDLSQLEIFITQLMETYNE